MKIFEEIPERSDSIEGNAIQKAQYICHNYSVSCFADDTGLEVSALDNKPGIYSARYAGPECCSRNNIKRVLAELAHINDRQARFRTVIAYSNRSYTKTFEGIVEGRIAYKPAGDEGFGYDPIFIPNGFNQTFAEMTLEQKNAISHRSRALKKFIEFLLSIDV